MPSNELTGTVFQVDQTRTRWAITDTLRRDPAALLAQHQRRHYGAGPDGISRPDLLGYEWDFVAGQRLHAGRSCRSLVDNGEEPTAYNTNWGMSTPRVRRPTTWSSTATRRAARSVSGRGLCSGRGACPTNTTIHQVLTHRNTTDPNVQQAMVNLFADMGVQPQRCRRAL